LKYTHTTRKNEYRGSQIAAVHQKLPPLYVLPAVQMTVQTAADSFLMFPSKNKFVELLTLTFPSSQLGITLPLSLNQLSCFPLSVTRSSDCHQPLFPSCSSNCSLSTQVLLSLSLSLAVSLSVSLSLYL
jgi:hypothetical protein